MRAAFSGFHPNARIILESCPGGPQMGAGRTRSLGALERGPHRPHRRRLPSDAALYGAGRRLLDGGRGRPGALPRAHGLDGFAEAFRKFERNRKERTSRIQLGARKNIWMRTAPDTAWLYDYDAWDRAVELTAQRAYGCIILSEKPSNFSRDMHPEVDQYPRLRHRQPGNLDCRERQRSALHRFAPHFDRSRQIT